MKNQGLGADPNLLLPIDLLAGREPSLKENTPGTLRAVAGIVDGT